MKQRDCKIKGFEGHVLFCDPLNMEQVFAIEEAQEQANNIEPSAFLTKINEVNGVKDDEGNAIKAHWTSRADRAFLPSVLLCVKEWHLKNVPESVTLESFPMTPRGEAHALVEWLWTELLVIYQGETDIPNE